MIVSPDLGISSDLAKASFLAITAVYSASPPEWWDPGYYLYERLSVRTLRTVQGNSRPKPPPVCSPDSPCPGDFRFISAPIYAEEGPGQGESGLLCSRFSRNIRSISPYRARYSRTTFNVDSRLHSRYSWFVDLRRMPVPPSFSCFQQE